MKARWQNYSRVLLLLLSSAYESTNRLNVTRQTEPAAEQPAGSKQQRRPASQWTSALTPAPKLASLPLPLRCRCHSDWRHFANDFRNALCTNDKDINIVSYIEHHSICRVVQIWTELSRLKALVCCSHRCQHVVVLNIYTNLQKVIKASIISSPKNPTTIQRHTHRYTCVCVRSIADAPAHHLKFYK